MLKRLLLYLCLLWRITAKDPEECSIRVDVLDGSDLVEAVALFLADSTQALDPQQCASDCFRHNCDVAYFDMVSRRCQFSSDTSETVRSSCDNFETVEMKAGVAELDKVKRYCIHCIEDEVHGGSERSADSNPHLQQVNSNDFEKKIVVTPAKTQQEISDFIAPVQHDSFERISDDNSHKSIGSTSESISMVIQEELPLVSPPNHKSTGTTSESKGQFSAQDDVPTPPRHAHKPVGTISVHLGGVSEGRLLSRDRSAANSLGNVSLPRAHQQQVPLFTEGSETKSFGTTSGDHPRSGASREAPIFLEAVSHKSVGSTLHSGPTDNEVTVPVFKITNSHKSEGITSDVTAIKTDDTDVPIFQRENSIVSARSSQSFVPIARATTVPVFNARRFQDKAGPRRPDVVPSRNSGTTGRKYVGQSIIPGRRMKVYSRKLYRQYGGGSSSSHVNHATQKSSSVFSPKRWRTDRHRQLTYQRGILSQPHRHRARRIYGYSFRKGIKPNYYDADKRPRANAVARLNTARLVKKKMMSSGVAK